MKELTHLGTRLLQTDRLLLRPYCADDAQAVFSGWMGDAEICETLNWQPHGDVSVTRRLVDMWVESYQSPTVYHWCITLQGAVAGDIMVCKWNQDDQWCELGYCVAKAYQGRGIASEALLRVSRYLLEDVGFHRIQLRHTLGNEASGRVMQKCGFRYEGTLRHAKRSRLGEWQDIVCYALLHEELAGMSEKQEKIGNTAKHSAT